MRIFSYELDIAPHSIWNIVAATVAAKSNFIYLQEAGHFFAGPKYYTTREGLDSFLIKLTVSGRGIIEYGGQREPVAPGSFFWIDCQNYQNYYTDPKVGHWEVVWAHFNGQTARAYYESYRKLKRAVAVAAVQDSSMYTLLETLLTHSAQPQFPLATEQNLVELDVQTSGIITQLIMECFSSIGSLNKLQHIPPMVQSIRNYLVARYNEKITLAHLAAQFNLDPYYLQKLFKRYIGQSPMEHIIHLRMLHAKSLIRTSTMSISDIACKVGVENISHFTRQFKKHEGMSPSQYRKFWLTS